ncbi:hypothetical protein A3F07_00020 [candidate division WWE3 bacterium RIFCSPHIGHO2_12_FULL_38_15]|nr:MAG: hypothetical protein A2793_01180 [candidate division WWE3 bacterium RIFCSPHIGHO2_01_FULL_38_45]OGC49224.1 MAG: hypothetical protein A3F07_00020 [candidate division WWE3 bacterium RIFCSPHIGHO2_12_FULL_38_15]OGC54119.1 MAG: hypothetical protein A3B64_00285 [candidate division WWE3 bacterium RIFCSPLOWO2_01_FULL_37_24]HLB51314.1 DUF4135 domain-containing protein [Patescibacteria group bacterium]
MPQEPVAEAYKIIQEYLKKIEPVVYGTYFSDILYDLVIPCATYFYYQNREYTKTDYFSYLKRYLESEFENTRIFSLFNRNRILVQSYDALLPEDVRKDMERELLGDVHSSSIKIKCGDYIVYRNTLNYALFLNNLSKTLPEFSCFIPKFHKIDGWIYRNFISLQKDKVSLKEYYYELGRFIAFILFLRALDINSENVIALTYPIAFDLEIILSPEYADFKYDIKATGLLSGQTLDNNSAVLGGMYVVYNYLKPVLFLAKDESPRIKWKTPSMRKFYNLPVSHKSDHPFKYIEQILKGYNNGFKYLTEQINSVKEIVRSTDFNVRIFVRPTRFYKFLTSEYSYPQTFLKTASADFFAKRLAASPLLEPGKIHKKTLVKYEVEELNKLSIPFFYSNVHSKEIFAADGTVVGLMSTSPAVVWKNFADQSPEFFNKQGKTIYSLLESNYKKYNRKKVPHGENTYFIKE